MNRSIHFPVLVFLVLVGLLLLLTGSEIFSRASRPKSGFEKAINDAPVETAGLVRQDFVDTFPEPVKGKISVNYQASSNAGWRMSQKRLTSDSLFDKPV